eukprot:3397357-Pleurochrysis_carterae.AAC.1
MVGCCECVETYWWHEAMDVSRFLGVDRGVAVVSPACSVPLSLSLSCFSLSSRSLFALHSSAIYRLPCVAAARRRTSGFLCLFAARRSDGHLLEHGLCSARAAAPALPPRAEPGRHLQARRGTPLALWPLPRRTHVHSHADAHARACAQK